MNNREKIIAEIERLKAEAFNNVKNRSLVTDVANSQRIAICEQLLDFITSLPAEQPSERLGDEIDHFRCSDEFALAKRAGEEVAATAQHFAQWQKEQLINKACNWFNQHVVDHHPRTGQLKPVVNINAFREAMEKEDE